MKDQLTKYLQEQGLMPTEESFGIGFKYQMCNFAILIDDEDWQFLRIVLPFIFDVTAENRAEVLEAMNKMNTEMKVVKACIWPENSVSIFAEQLIDKTPNYDDLVPRTLNILLAARDSFYKALQG